MPFRWAPVQTWPDRPRRARRTPVRAVAPPVDRAAGSVGRTRPSAPALASLPAARPGAAATSARATTAAPPPPSTHPVPGSAPSYGARPGAGAAPTPALAPPRSADALPGRSRAPRQPRLSLAVVSCVDARLDPLAALGLRRGDAVVLRNAGGLVTDDVLRSLAIAQRALHVNRIALLQHTDCLGLAVDHRAFAEQLRREAGVEPRWTVPEAHDPASAVRAGVLQLTASPFVLPGSEVRGFVLDLANGQLSEVPVRRPPQRAAR